MIKLHRMNMKIWTNKVQITDNLLNKVKEMIQDKKLIKQHSK